MATVIDLMAQRTKTGVKPKSETFRNNGQPYTITYDPVSEKWVWVYRHVRVFTYTGTTEDFGKAHVAARRRIHKCNRYMIAMEEERLNGEDNAKK